MMPDKCVYRQMTTGELLQALREKLSPVHGIEESTAMIYRLFEHYLGYNRARAILERDNIIGRQKLNQILKAADKLVRHMPLQYITGEAYFCGFRLSVNRHVLIPRPETEEMVLITIGLLKDRPPKNLIDIGTGSGCIAVALKKQFPESRTIAADISKNALRLASANAVMNNTEIEYIHADILKPAGLSTLPRFDLIISNPPYVRESEKAAMKPNVVDYEPHKALFVTDEAPLKYYQAIGSFARQHLFPDGYLVFEINENLGKQTIDLLRGIGFTRTELKPDFRGRDRFVLAQQ